MAKQLWRIVSLFLFVLLLPACASKPPAATPVDSAPPPATTPTVPAAPPKPVEPGTAAWLFPVGDWQSVYEVKDEGSASPAKVTEELIRDGDRVIAVYNGKPYATWFMNDRGVWRKDPKGEAMLRYLPPVLKHETYWKQVSGESVVWFRLREGSKDCWGLTTKGVCWELLVLNRGEATEFRFDAGRGPIVAESDDRRNPANSFLKKLVSDRAGNLMAAERAALLKQAAPMTGGEAPVVAVTRDEFEAAVLKEPVAAGDLDGNGKIEYVYLQSGMMRVTTQSGQLLYEHPVGSVGSTYHAEKHALPGGQVMIELSLYGRCFKGGPETTLLWYDAKVKAYRARPEPGQYDCKVYTYQGDGRYQIYQSHNGGPLDYTEQASWRDGQFVTESRTYGLYLQSVTPDNLDRVLNHVATGDVSGEGLFRSPALLKEFKERTSQGVWSFKAEGHSSGEIRLAASRDGKPQGTLTVKTGPQTATDMPGGNKFGAIMIEGLSWPK